MAYGSVDYRWSARVVSVYDGDTITFEIDRGFSDTTTRPFRLEGFNTPETRGEEREKGLIAKSFLLKLLPLGSKCVITSVKMGKYRYLARVELATGLWLHDVMINHGLAKPYDGSGPVPRFPKEECYPLEIDHEA